MGRSFTVIDYDCGICRDLGYTEKEGLYATMPDGNQVYLPVTTQKACTCELGIKLLTEFQIANKCNCNYGLIERLDDIATPWVRTLEFCLNCHAGRQLDREYAGLVEQYNEKKAAQMALEDGIEGLTGKTFDNFLTYDDATATALSDVFTACKGFKSVYIVGATGSGKTHLATAYYNHWRSLNKSGAFKSISDLLMQLRSTKRPGYEGPDENEIVRGLIEAELLVLDDLGQEKPTDYTNDVLFTILNGRLNRGRTTVLTSNIRLHDLDRVGFYRSIQSRLKAFEYIPILATDYREREAS